MTYSEKLGGHWVPAPAGWRVHFRSDDGENYEYHVVGWLTDGWGDVFPLVWDETALTVIGGIGDIDGLSYIEVLGPGEPCPWKEPAE